MNINFYCLFKEDELQECSLYKENLEEGYSPEELDKAAQEVAGEDFDDLSENGKRRALEWLSVNSEQTEIIRIKVDKEDLLDCINNDSDKDFTLENDETVSIYNLLNNLDNYDLYELSNKLGVDMNKLEQFLNEEDDFDDYDDDDEDYDFDE